VHVSRIERERKITSTRTKRGGEAAAKQRSKQQEKKYEQKWLAFGGQGDLLARHNRCGASHG
jgi:hypothetical protein